MSKNRLKLLIWLSLLALVVVAFFLALAGAGNLIVYFSSGADPSSALNLIPAAPNDMEQRLHWLPEQIPDSPGYRSDFRPLEPFTRDQIAGAYLRAWSQWNISYHVGVPYGLKSYFSGPALAEVSAAVTAVGKSGWEITQNDLRHNLLLTFYADDGQVVAFTDREASVVQVLTPPDGGASQMIETSGTYDVVMLLEDGNWRVRLWQRQDVTTPPMLQPLQTRPRLVYVNDGQLTLDGKSFDIAGVNYYPQAMPWEQFWAEYHPRLTSVDLARVRSLGLNTVRIFIPFDQFGGGKPDEIYLARLANFLAQANTQRLKVIVTLFDHRTDHDPGNWAADGRHLAGLIPLFAEHPAILAWDVKNEPDRDYAANSPELTRAWLRHIVYEIRRYDRQHLLTIGWSTPAAADDLIELVDIVSYHFYAPAADYPAQLATLETAAAGKPLLLQEFGLPTWNSIFPNGHTEAEQATYYADLLTIQRKSRTAGYLAWTLYDFDTVSSEFKLPWQRGPQANLGVLRQDGTPKSAAALLSPNADLAAVPRVPAWSRFSKPFWLLIFALSGLFFAGGLFWWSRHVLRRYWQWQRQVLIAGHTAVRVVWRVVVYYLPWKVAGRLMARLWSLWSTWRKARNRRDDVQTGASITATNGLSVDATKTRQIGSTEVMSPNTNGDIARVKLKKKKKKSTSSKKKSKAPIK